MNFCFSLFIVYQSSLVISCLSHKVYKNNSCGIISIIAEGNEEVHIFPKSESEQNGANEARTRLLRCNGDAPVTNCNSYLKHGEALLWVHGAFAYCKVRDLQQVKNKLNQTGYHSILPYHAITSGTHLVGQGFVLMQDNDPKHTSKLCQAKRNSTSYNWCLGWRKSADLNPIELVWDELD